MSSQSSLLVFTAPPGGATDQKGALKDSIDFPADAGKVLTSDGKTATWETGGSAPSYACAADASGSTIANNGSITFDTPQFSEGLISAPPAGTSDFTIAVGGDGVYSYGIMAMGGVGGLVGPTLTPTFTIVNSFGNLSFPGPEYKVGTSLRQQTSVTGFIQLAAGAVSVTVATSASHNFTPGGIGVSGFPIICWFRLEKLISPAALSEAREAP